MNIAYIGAQFIINLQSEVIQKHIVCRVDHDHPLQDNLALVVWLYKGSTTLACQTSTSSVKRLWASYYYISIVDINVCCFYCSVLPGINGRRLNFDGAIETLQKETYTTEDA